MKSFELYLRPNEQPVKNFAFLRMTDIADGQYEFNGRMYPSLSMIAREITGTRWSGLLVFGLKAPAKAKPKGGR